jgi:hypothetical protein
MATTEEELAATLKLLFATLNHKQISSALNAAVPPDDYWLIAREWLMLIEAIRRGEGRE